ncbi:uncharacterized protein LOC18429779 [Amborella trichopoda]|uniref:Seed maturation-like protein n=1 Tax=Amborella trichopoda TaxID=13333 RepID=W1P257_AMBTC|nr:uncharacterized protein LOC18429779 [Amborella trichopoda]ERN01694.1 hypothetical protein AMTR_s00090p00160330 [Amborella trichopoda]|eukprot:XP_006839125.1 uncharacterized protein LOC18429779 [Amborella trichopoda]
MAAATTASAAAGRAFSLCCKAASSSSSASLFFSPNLKPQELGRPSSSLFLVNKRKSERPRINCLIPGVDGGLWEGGEEEEEMGDFVSTRKGGFKREFKVLANMLKQIEPFDTSAIGKSASACCKESMKHTISSMLGLLPSDHFSVTVTVSRHPLARLLTSSIMTGYTLWNAEYRISLTRNLNLTDETMAMPSSQESNVLKSDDSHMQDGVDKATMNGSGLDVPEGLRNLSPTVLNYIQELRTALASVEKELNDQKLENMQIESNGDGSNALLQYLRSLEPEMVTELSRPSSSEVEEIVQQLVESILQRFFKDDIRPKLMDDLARTNTEAYSDEDAEHCDSIGTSRDYLARLLFWCMLLGHHMRGLEYRLHLSCAVGLL